MASVRFIKPTESVKNKKYISSKRLKHFWQVISFVELVIIIYGIIKYVN